MKTSLLKRFLGFLAAVLTATTAFHSPADEVSPSAKPEKTRTGTVVSVNPKDHTLSIREWAMLHKYFNLGDACTYAMLGNSNGTVNDLRPGEKVVVRYQNIHGVLIADEVRQLAMQYEGKVTAINPTTHQLTVHQTGGDKRLQIADGCSVVLLHQKAGVVADIRPGDHVTVTYETPADAPTAREIAQTSIDFTGKLTAIDLAEKTVKATAMFESKKFILADDCAIIINGRTDGKLSDLKPNDKLTFTYDEINGVNVVNRIGPEESRNNAMAYEPATTTTVY